MTGSQWFGLLLLGVGLGFVGYHVLLLRRRRVLRVRGVAARGRVLSVTRQAYKGDRGWVSQVEFVDASGTTRRFKARGRFDGDVGISYDPKRPTRAHVTTRSPYPRPARWQLILVYAGLSIVILMIIAVLVAGVLLMTGLWDLNTG